MMTIEFMAVSQDIGLYGKTITGNLQPILKEVRGRAPFSREDEYFGRYIAPLKEGLFWD